MILRGHDGALKASVYQMGVMGRGSLFWLNQAQKKSHLQFLRDHKLVEVAKVSLPNGVPEAYHWHGMVCSSIKTGSLRVLLGGNSIIFPESFHSSISVPLT